MKKDPSGMCYANSSSELVGWWDAKKRLAFQKPTFPSQDYYKYKIEFVLEIDIIITN